MLIGAHVLLYSDKSEADRAFLRDILDFPFVDVGHGWLIFKLPPAEVAVHPTEPGENRSQVHAGHGLLGGVLYLMCDDLQAYIKQLAAKGISCTEVGQEPWGIRTSVKLPSGSELGIYQPRHATAFNLASPRKKTSRPSKTRPAKKRPRARPAKRRKSR